MVAMLTLLPALASSSEIVGQSYSLKVIEPSNKELTKTMMATVPLADGSFGIIRGLGKMALIAGRSTNAAMPVVLDVYDGNNNFEKTISLDNIKLVYGSQGKGDAYMFYEKDSSGDLVFYYARYKDGVNSILRRALDSSYELQEEELVATIPSKIKVDRRGAYEKIESIDKSHMAIYSMDQDKKAEETEIFLVVLDENRKLKYTNTSMLPQYKEPLSWGWRVISAHQGRPIVSNIISASVSNGGIFNLCSRVTADKKSKWVEHLVYAISSDSTPKAMKYELGDAYARDIKLAHNAAGELCMVGLFSDEPFGFLTGLFVNTFSAADLSPISTKLNTFSKEQVLEYLLSVNPFDKKSDEKVKKKLSGSSKVGISVNFVLRDVFFAEDGSLLVASEFYRMNRNMTSSSLQEQSAGVGKVETEHRFGDMVFLGCTADGEVKWITNADRKQEAANDIGLSTTPMFVQGKINFFTNDYRTQELVHGQVDGNGELASKVICELSKKGANKGLVLMPGSLVELDGQDYLGVGIRLLRQGIMKLSVK